MRLLRNSEAVNGSNKPRRTPALSTSKSSKNQDRNEIAPNKRWMIGSRLAAEYNQVKPHSSLDGCTPSEYKTKFDNGLTLQVA